jgi:hypothetical protein
VIRMRRSQLRLVSDATSSVNDRPLEYRGESTSPPRIEAQENDLWFAATFPHRCIYW